MNRNHLRKYYIILDFVILTSTDRVRKPSKIHDIALHQRENTLKLQPHLQHTEKTVHIDS